MKRLCILLLTLLCLASSSLALAKAKPMVLLPDSGKVVGLDIYCITDFQGHVLETRTDPGAVRLSGILQNLGKQNLFGNVFLGGSNMLNGLPENDKYQGKPAIMALNAMAITADVAGSKNFANPLSVIKEQRSQSYFATLAANILDKNGKVADPFKNGVILTRNGVDVGVIGLVSPTIKNSVKPENLAGLTIVPPEAVAQKLINSMRKDGAQVIVLLTSLSSKGEGKDGISGEVTGLLDKLTGVDAVITGESGILAAGTYKGIPVVQGGSFGQNIARIHIEYDREAKKIVDSEARYYVVKDMPPAVDKVLAKDLDKVMVGMDIAKTASGIKSKKAKKSKYVIGGSGGGRYIDGAGNVVNGPLVVANNVKNLANDLQGQSPAAEFCVDILQQAFQPDAVLYNGSSFKSGLPAGDITNDDVAMLLGKGQKNLITADVTGKTIKEAVEHGLNPSLGLIRFANLKVVADVHKPEGQRIQSITFKDGSPVEDGTLYTVVLNDFMYKGGEGYKMFSKAKNVKGHGTQTDLFRFAFKTYGQFNYVSDGRLHF